MSYPLIEDPEGNSIYIANHGLSVGDTMTLNEWYFYTNGTNSG